MTYIVLQTIFVYFFLIFILYTLGKKSQQTGKMIYIVQAILIYAVIWGLRYGVGTDCISYIEDYNLLLKSGYIIKEQETGYFAIQRFFAYMDAHSFFYMAFIAFFQIFATYYYFKDKKEIFPYIGITFILSTTCIVYGNGMRQVMAFAFFMFAMYFLERKKILFHYLMILLAISMHNSAYLLLLMYPLYLVSKDISVSNKIQYVVLLVSILLGRVSLFDSVSSYIDLIANYSGYEIYTQDANYIEHVFKQDNSIGIGYVINVFAVILIIRGSSLMKEKYPDMKFFYNLYFIGVVLRYVFMSSKLIQRVNYYFYGFEFIIAAIILCTYFIDKRYRDYRMLLGAYCLVLFANLYRMFENRMAFYFIWQDDLFYKYLITH